MEGSYIEKELNKRVGVRVKSLSSFSERQGGSLSLLSLPWELVEESSASKDEAV